MNRRQAIVAVLAIGAGRMLVVPAASEADPAPDATAKELAKFDGNWELASSITDGKIADLGDGTRSVLVFDGGRMAAVERKTPAGQERDRPVGFGTVKVNAGEGPAQIDWKYGYGFNTGRAGLSYGIYKFEQDTLTICVGKLDSNTARSATRPTQFESREGTGVSLLVYKRVKHGIRLQDILQDFHFPAELNEPPAK